MPRSTTTYDLLVSCPSDVTEYLDVIKDCVEEFNRNFGKANNVEISLQHWSTDSYPQSGGKPQNLINEQIVSNADAAVAIFWTRFGTPTDNYGSGTEEEIEHMLSDNKQVFMYFLDAPIEPSKIDNEQYNKVLQFKTNYADKGLYDEIKNKEEFRRKFNNHLTAYFLQKIIGNDNNVNNKKLQPKLLLKNITGAANDFIHIETKTYNESFFMYEKMERIQEIISEINDNILPSRTPQNRSIIEKKLSNSVILQIAEEMNNPDIIEDVKFSENIKDRIDQFAYENSIELRSGFYNIGNLKQKRPKLVLPNHGYDISYEGTDTEKQRYDLINELYTNIVEYNEYYQFFSFVDSCYFVRMAVQNNGTRYDEDIDVKLFIEKNKLIKYSDFPYPGRHIIEKILEANLIDKFWGIETSDSVQCYTNYPVPEFNGSNFIQNSLIKPSINEIYDRHKRQYRSTLKQLFCYQVFENDDYDVIQFNINYLKHNTTMGFPSVLVFSDSPVSFNYEITSKYIPNVINGTFGEEHI